MIFFLGLVIASISTGFLLNSIAACFLILGIGIMIISMANYIDGKGPV